MRKLLLGILLIATVAAAAAFATETLRAAPAPAPDLSASPSSLRFGRVPVSVESQLIDVTITNNTGTVLTMDTAATNAATPAGFGFANNNCTTLEASCWVSVVFKPTAVGKVSPTNWTITFSGGYTVTIKVSGTGYTPNKPTPF